MTNEIIDNHQHRRHTSVRDQCQVEGVQDEYDEIIGIISTIDIGEEPAKDETIEVQVQNDGEDGIDDTRREKENSHEDFPEAGPMSNVDEILTNRH